MCNKVFITFILLMLQVTIYVRPQMVGKTAFAAKAAPLIQAWLEQETGIPYALPKMGE